MFGVRPWEMEQLRPRELRQMFAALDARKKQQLLQQAVAGIPRV